jgi:hypothetical protein
MAVSPFIAGSLSGGFGHPRGYTACSLFPHFLIIPPLFSAEGEKEGHEGFHPLPEAGEDVFYQPLLDSYGGSIHRVYLLHFPPWQLFHPRFTSGMDDPILAQRLARIRNLYPTLSTLCGSNLIKAADVFSKQA